MAESETVSSSGPVLSAYARSLGVEEKKDYLEKLKLCGCDCPYSIPKELFKYGKDLHGVIPPVSEDQIVLYLILRHGGLHKEQYLAYKNVKQDQYLTNGFLTEVGALCLSNHNVILKGRVTHSQAINTSTETWICFTQEGTVITAHCNCVAG